LPPYFASGISVGSSWIDFFAVAIAVNMAGKISRPVKSQFSEGFLGAGMLLFLI
jgi:hypothetical protein